MVETLKLSPEQLPVWLGAGKRQGPPVYKGRRMVTAGGFYQDGGWGELLSQPGSLSVCPGPAAGHGLLIGSDCF